MHPLARTKVALAIETDSLRVLVVRGRRVQRWMSYPLPPNEVQDGAGTASGALQEVVTALFSGGNRLKGQKVVSLSGARSLFRTIGLPRLKQHLVAEAVAREASQELPMEREQLHLFWQVFQKTRDWQEILLAGVQKEAYDRLHGAFRGAKVRPRLWELKSLALVRAVGLAQAVILDLEPGAVDLILVSEGAPRLVRSLPEPPGLTGEERARGLAEHVSRTVEYYLSSQLGGTVPWEPHIPGVLTGQMAADQELSTALSAVMPFPVEPFTSPLECSPDFPSSMYAACLGSALKRGRPKAGQLGQRSIDFNVYPAEYHRRPLPARAAALVLALALGVGLLVPMYQVRAGSSEGLAERRAGLARLQRLTGVAKANLVERGEVQGQMEVVRGLISTLQDERDALLHGRERVSEELRTSLEALPPGVSLVRFSTEGDFVSLEGEGPDSAAVLSYARFLKESGRFATVVITDLALKTTESSVPEVIFLISMGRHQRELPIKGG